MHIGYWWDARRLGRPRHKWVDNIKMSLIEIEWCGVVWCGLDWYGSGYGLVEGSCEHEIEPLGSVKCCEAFEWLHNWRLQKKGSAP
jgi:hypothetical protein